MAIHIGRDGSPKPCRAKKSCPFGGANLHFDDLDSAQTVADSLNHQLASMSGLGFAQEGDFVRPSAQTELAVVKLHNMNLTMKKLESLREKARNQIIKEYEAKGITPNSIDSLKETLKDFNEKQGNQYIQLSNEEGSKLESYSRKIIQSDGSPIDFKITMTPSGPEINRDTEKALIKLADFEKKYQRAKELEREIKTALMEEMKEAGVDNVQVGDAKLNYVDVEKILREQEIERKRREKYKTVGPTPKNYIKSGYRKVVLKLESTNTRGVAAGYTETEYITIVDYPGAREYIADKYGASRATSASKRRDFIEGERGSVQLNHYGYTQLLSEDEYLYPGDEEFEF